MKANSQKQRCLALPPSTVQFTGVLCTVGDGVLL